MATVSLDEPVPVGIRQREAVRLHPPDAPDARVDEGLLALAVGGLMAVLDQLLRLPGGERQADRPQSLDLQPGQDGGALPADAEGAGSIDLVQRLAELLPKVLSHRCLLAAILV